MKRFFAFALLACAPAFAAVPNLFVAGQPARAEDMNRNLFYLDSATATKASLASVNTIQIAVSSLQSSKATQSALNDALKLIAAKVGSADLEKMLKGKADTSTVRILGDLVAKKAESDQLNEVKESVRAKADTLEVQALEKSLSKKADVTWVTSQIAASAPSGMLSSSKNLSELSDKAAARTNLGLGALAVKASLTAADVGALSTQASANFARLNGADPWGEWRFSMAGWGVGTYRDPENGVPRDAKFGGKGIATNGLHVNGDATVSGTITGTVVTMGIRASNVADYVFEPDYKLAPLSEVEAYTKAHKHLPEVPSATEIEKGGLDLAQMNLLLLKKVEELTLHTIALEKRMKAMEAGDRAQ